MNRLAALVLRGPVMGRLYAIRWPALLLASLLTSVKSCRHIDDGDPSIHVVAQWGARPQSWVDVAIIICAVAFLVLDMLDMWQTRKAAP